MEKISGSSNWKLVIRREPEYITVLWAATCDRRAALPEELFDLPVTTLGDHAMTPGRRPPEGEEILMTCGPAEGEWDNRQLEDLQLPRNLKRVENYGLFNCTALRTLRLYDTVRYWGGGALMNCRSLDTFHLQCSGQEGEVLAYLADELSRELDVTLHWPKKEPARLIFPEYAEVYEENVPHHQFDFHIHGAGYPYHHCFYQRTFSFRDYDQLWKGYLAMGHDEECAMRLAWWRLRYPVELAGTAEQDYLIYVRAHAAAAARWRLEQRDPSGLQFLLSKVDWERETLTELCALARQQNSPEALALLLEEQHRRFPTGLDKTFDL